MRLLITLFLGFTFGAISVQSAGSITFGKDVLNGSSRYPSVVSVWYAEDTDEDYYPICTGTLIESRIVLTAAHCVLNEGIYAVGYGSDLLKNAKLQNVSATWRNPAYSARQMVNDIGLLLLEKSIPFITPTALATSKEISSIVSNKKVKFEIVGWGKNQNEEPATYLRMAAVNDQSSVMKKYKNWRNDVWLAVGKYNKKERVYSGACNGDSGGPLFATANGETVLAGVTSWGAEDCEYAAPSIYVRLSYYINTIQKEGIPTLLRNESTQNRSVPSVVREPRITASVSPTLTYTCDKGVWSANTSQVSLSWSGPGIPWGSTNPTITAPENSSGSSRTLTCTVTAINSNGTIKRVVTVSQASKPVAITAPSISGMPAVAGNSTTSVSCSAGTFSAATTITQDWWIGDSFSPSTRISDGNTLSVNTDFFSKNGGKYLYCISTASGEGGTGTSTSRGVVVPSFQKPQVQTFPTISGVKEWQSPTINTVASCAGWAWKSSVTQEVVEWYSNSTYSLSGATKLGTGTTLTLTENILTTYKSRYLMCAVSGTNLGGTMTMYDGLYLYYYPSSTPTPTPTPTPTRTSTPSPTPTPSPTNPITSVKPNAPFNFTGIIGTSSVALSWTFPGGNGLPITDFVIERSTSTSGWIVLNDGVNTEIRFTDTGLSPGTRYDYRVRAYNGYNYSDYSSTISASIPVAATPTPTPTPTATPTPTPTTLPAPTITSSKLSTALGADASGDYLINADIASTSRVDVTINVSSPSLVKEVVIGLKPVSSTNFYDWGVATASDQNAVWVRSAQMPTVNPAPVCTNGVSSKVMWEVKYEIRLTNGSNLSGVLPTKIARVFTGIYCPTGLYPMFGTATGTVDGFTVQITNYDSTFSWTVGNAVRADLTLNGTATTTISSSGLVTMSGLKPGVTASLIVTTTKSGNPTQQSAFAATSLSSP